MKNIQDVMDDLASTRETVVIYNDKAFAIFTALVHNCGYETKMLSVERVEYNASFSFMVVVPENVTRH